MADRELLTFFLRLSFPRRRESRDAGGSRQLLLFILATRSALLILPNLYTHRARIVVETP